MEYLRFLAVVALICTYVSGEPQLSIDISSQEAEIGSDVTVRCRIAEYSPGVFLKWNKKQLGEEIQMGTNSVINNPFEATGRYASRTDTVGTEVVFVMDILGAQPEDAGEIYCSIPTIAGSEVFTTLSIVSPVQQVELFGIRSNESDAEMIMKYTDGEVVNFNEGDEYFFMCQATGSNPEADMIMTIGPKDITHLFRKEDQVIIGEGHPGLKPIQHVTKLTTSKAVIVTFEQNTHRFGCSASVKNEVAQEIGITAMLKFAPRVECKDLLEGAYTRDIKLTCSIRADPPVNHVEMHWYHKDDSNTTLHPNQKEGHYHLTLEDGSTSDEKLAVLNIERAYPQTFRTYYLIASNDKTEVSSHVTLSRDRTAEVVGAAPACSTVSIFSLITATLAAIFIQS